MGVGLWEFIGMLPVNISSPQYTGVSLDLIMFVPDLTFLRTMNSRLGRHHHPPPHPSTDVPPVPPPPPLPPPPSCFSALRKKNHLAQG